MQWIYLICFILLSAGLLALFGVKPGDFIDALFRSQRKSATLSDELNVLLGTPAKGFFNQDYELKQILKGTGRADRYEAIKRLSLILFAVGAVLALLIGNVYMVPILGIGFSLIPIWYLRSTAASYKKHLNEELETAISIITTSYLRTEDLIRSVKENLPYINEPVKANFEAFVYEAELINANITSAINSLTAIWKNGKSISGCKPSWDWMHTRPTSASFPNICASKSFPSVSRLRRTHPGVLPERR